MVPAVTLAFAASFMLCFNEPLMMYFSNINDFWFDSHIMVGPTLIFFSLVFLSSSALFIGIYLLTTKLFKKPIIYNILLIGSFILFFTTYIQGNYLSYNLPALDGSVIEWQECTVDMIVSAVLLFIITAIIIIACKKMGFSKVIKYSTFVTVAIFAMLSLSLITTAVSSNGFISKDQAYVTTNNLHNISSDKNLLILVVDAVDSQSFSKVIEENPAYQEIFTDFSYYPDTVSAYTFTRDAIPHILSGKLNHNEKSFLNYYEDAIKNSELLDKLEQADYDINIYDDELPVYDKRIQNLGTEEATVSKKCFIAQEAKYTLFRYLPFYLKPFSRIDTLNFSNCRNNTSLDAFTWWAQPFYQTLIDNPLTTQDRKYFQFVHIEGAHVPFNMDKDLNTITDGTYDQKIEASIKVIGAYLKRLRDSSYYNNSAVIIMSDHGYNSEAHNYRQNPLLLIKGINEEHKFTVDNTPVSYHDLQSIYNALINGHQTNTILQDIDQNRTRLFIDNLFNHEDHMVEYEQHGHAWDKNGIKVTGEEYNL